MNAYEKAQDRIKRTKVIAKGVGVNGVDGPAWWLTKTMLIVEKPGGYTVYEYG